MQDTGTWTVKAGLAQMLKGGVIMDVVNAEQAVIAAEAGACAVHGLGARPRRTYEQLAAWPAWPTLPKIKEIMAAVSVPVMAKCRIGHFVEAQVLEAMGVDYIDESEVLTVGRRGQPRLEGRFQGALRMRLPQPG